MFSLLQKIGRCIYCTLHIFVKNFPFRTHNCLYAFCLLSFPLNTSELLPNVQHQSAIWESSAAAAQKTRVVPREAGGARRTSLDVHRQNRKRKAEHLTGKRGENLQGAEGLSRKTVQGYSLIILRDLDQNEVMRKRNLGKGVPLKFPASIPLCISQALASTLSNLLEGAPSLQSR